MTHLLHCTSWPSGPRDSERGMRATLPALGPGWLLPGTQRPHKAAVWPPDSEVKDWGCEVGLSSFESCSAPLTRGCLIGAIFADALAFLLNVLGSSLHHTPPTSANPALLQAHSGPWWPAFTHSSLPRRSII